MWTTGIAMVSPVPVAGSDPSPKFSVQLAIGPVLAERSNCTESGATPEVTLAVSTALSGVNSHAQPPRAKPNRTMVPSRRLLRIPTSFISELARA